MLRPASDGSIVLRPKQIGPSGKAGKAVIVGSR